MKFEIYFRKIKGVPGKKVVRIVRTPNSNVIQPKRRVVQNTPKLMPDYMEPVEMPEVVKAYKSAYRSIS